jgi:hypothetical protein
MPRWKPFFSLNRGTQKAEKGASRASSDDDLENGSVKPPKWSLGVLNDKQTDEVPGKSDWLDTKLAASSPKQNLSVTNDDL